MSGLAGIELRPPRLDDAREVWRLVGEVGALERNSCYTYLLLCSHFAGTCVLADGGDRLLGFALAYRPPSAPDDLFVWQIGVSVHAQGRGLGLQLLDAVVALPGSRGARNLTATVSPDNKRSIALFGGFARARGIPCTVEPGFRAACFAQTHPDENLLRIGPL